jgi:hypothetical protein
VESCGAGTARPARAGWTSAIRTALGALDLDAPESVAAVVETAPRVAVASVNEGTEFLETQPTACGRSSTPFEKSANGLVKRSHAAAESSGGGREFSSSGGVTHGAGAANEVNLGTRHQEGADDLHGVSITAAGAIFVGE